MQIPTNSVASLFTQMQSAVGASAKTGMGALQDLLGGAASSTGQSTQVASAAPVSLTATSPASQFSSQLLSALIAAQTGSSTSATTSTSSTSPTSLLSQLESALTGSGSFGGTLSTAAQSLTSLFGGPSGSDQSGSGQSDSGQTGSGGAANSPMAASQPTDWQDGAFHGHHHQFGTGDALKTLSADASSFLSKTASIAAGLLASV